MRISKIIVKQLQSYFNKAVNENIGNLEMMKQSIWATYYHLISTDEDPQHFYCPVNSWCSYNNSNDLSNYVHHHYVDPICIEYLKEIYEFMTRDEELLKILDGLTQNCNECVHGQIWRRASKSRFLSLSQLLISLYDTVLCYNDGYISRLKVFDIFNIKSSLDSKNLYKKLDLVRENRKCFKKNFNNRKVEDDSYKSKSYF